MKAGKRFFKRLLTLGMAAALALTPCTAFAADGDDAPEYTYMVKFSAGNMGTFGSASAVSVQSVSGSTPTITRDGNDIQIKGLKLGDRVVLDAQASGVVNLNDGEKYYVRGVRMSGRDNDSVATTSFEVDRDEEYVVAYGIKGDTVAYTVNFQDANGAELAPSRTYYGNIGDMPVAAYQYIEGYQPNAYNLTKTLSSNEADNVFTFVYSPNPTETVTTVVTETGTTTTGTATAGTTPAADAGTTPAAGTEGTETPATEGGVTVEEGDVPQDLVNLDEEEAPKANTDLDKTTRKTSSFPIVAGVLIVILAIGALVGSFIYLRKHRKNL